MALHGIGRMMGAALVLWLSAAPAAPPQEKAAADADEAFYRRLPIHKITVDRGSPAGGFELVFRTAGRKGGPILVLFHGIDDTGFSFAGLARELRDDFQMVIVDLPAYGDTFTPQPLDFSYARQTVRLRALIEAVGALDGAVLVGHSTGGALAWHLSLEPGVHPAGLILIDAITVDYDLPARTRLAFCLARHDRLSGPFFNLLGPGAIAGLIAGESASPGFRFSERAKGIQSAMFTTPARLRVNARWASQLLDFSVVKSWAPRLRDISVPTLLIWGRDDTVLEWPFMEEARKMIPGAQTHTVENAGHSPHVEKPDAVADAIRAFVAKSGPSARTLALSPEVRPVSPAAIPEKPRELGGSMIHLTFSVSRYGGDGLADAAGIHLKRGYYSTEYPSQSGSVGLFLEGLWNGPDRPLFAGLQIELVWYKAGGFRFAGGWSIAGARKTETLTTLGYVPSYLPWLCLGARWIGPRAKAGFFITLELAPFLNRAFFFWS
jgi:pimeloyl-ACP methyl ester carboxylesterase